MPASLRRRTWRRLIRLGVLAQVPRSLFLQRRAFQWWLMVSAEDLPSIGPGVLVRGPGGAGVGGPVFLKGPGGPEDRGPL